MFQVSAKHLQLLDYTDLQDVARVLRIATNQSENALRLQVARRMNVHAVRGGANVEDCIICGEPIQGDNTPATVLT